MGCICPITASHRHGAEGVVQEPEDDDVVAAQAEASEQEEEQEVLVVQYDVPEDSFSRTDLYCEDLKDDGKISSGTAVKAAWDRVVNAVEEHPVMAAVGIVAGIGLGVATVFCPALAPLTFGLCAAGMAAGGMDVVNGVAAAEAATTDDAAKAGAAQAITGGAEFVLSAAGVKTTWAPAKTAVQGWKNPFARSTDNTINIGRVGNMTGRKVKPQAADIIDVEVLEAVTVVDTAAETGGQVAQAKRMGRFGTGMTGRKKVNSQATAAEDGSAVQNNTAQNGAARPAATEVVTQAEIEAIVREIEVFAGMQKGRLAKETPEIINHYKDGELKFAEILIDGKEYIKYPDGTIKNYGDMFLEQRNLRQQEMPQAAFQAAQPEVTVVGKNDWARLQEAYRAKLEAQTEIGALMGGVSEQAVQAEKTIKMGKLGMTGRKKVGSQATAEEQAASAVEPKSGAAKQDAASQVGNKSKNLKAQRDEFIEHHQENEGLIKLFESQHMGPREKKTEMDFFPQYYPTEEAYIQAVPKIAKITAKNFVRDIVDSFEDTIAKGVTGYSSFMNINSPKGQYFIDMLNKFAKAQGYEIKNIKDTPIGISYEAVKTTKSQVKIPSAPKVQAETIRMGKVGMTGRKKVGPQAAAEEQAVAANKIPTGGAKDVQTIQTQVDALINRKMSQTEYNSLLSSMTEAEKDGFFGALKQTSLKLILNADKSKLSQTEIQDLTNLINCDPKKIGEVNLIWSAEGTLKNINFSTGAIESAQASRVIAAEEVAVAENNIAQAVKNVSAAENKVPMSGTKNAAAVENKVPTGGVNVEQMSKADIKAFVNKAETILEREKLSETEIEALLNETARTFQNLETTKSEIVDFSSIRRGALEAGKLTKAQSDMFWNLQEAGEAWTMLSRDDINKFMGAANKADFEAFWSRKTTNAEKDAILKRVFGERMWGEAKVTMRGLLEGDMFSRAEMDALMGGLRTE